MSLQRWGGQNSLEQNYSSTIDFKIFRTKYKTLFEKLQAQVTSMTMTDSPLHPDNKENLTLLIMDGLLMKT